MKKYILLILFSLTITACEESKIQPVTDTDAEDNDTVIESDETVDIAADNDPDKEVDDENIIDDVDVYNDPDMVFDDFIPDENDEIPDIDDASNEPCTYLFGRPNENTGLTWDQCKDFYNCEGVKFTAPVYTESDITILNSKIHLNPLPVLVSDPYETPELYPLEEEKACGLIWDTLNPDAYTLETFDSIDAAEIAGARVTHTGACGHCSSLQSLAVYIYQGDLATPVKKCTLDSILKGDDYLMECLQKLGFDENCAKIWMYNGKNTKKECMTTCLPLQNAVYHKSDGSLNDCIQCDEDKSGPVFQAVSGRTRRNSGLPTALCRPCNTISPIDHHY